MNSWEGEAAAETLREWLERNPIAFTLVETSKSKTAPVEIVERLSLKSLRFAFGQVLRVETGRTSQLGSKYLRVRLDDGRSFALAGIGIVFAPVFTSTGPVPDCPETACFKDYDRLFRHLHHLVHDHHEGHEREALQVLMVLLAFLDGARAIGLDVGREERELEKILKKLEALGASLDTKDPSC